MDLDRPQMSEVDPAGMRHRIGELPKQLLDGWQLVKELTLPEDYRQVTKVVILGMGGSAIGADLVRALAESTSPVPILVVREYNAPEFVDSSTLAIASSYSGDTEETLSALDEAIARGAKCAATGTGGILKQRAEDVGIPFIQFDYQSPPRAALGYSFICLAGLLRSAGLLSLREGDLQETVSVMRDWQEEIAPEVPTQDNAAKRLAQSLHGRLPVVYGAGVLSEVARRWKGQFNENAKSWGFFEVMPELNHNAVLGYVNPQEMAQRLFVLMLRSHADHPRVKVRYDITAELLADRGIDHTRVWARGDSPLAQVFSSIHFGDYVSLYLAWLYSADPTPVDAIEYLKRRLAQA